MTRNILTFFKSVLAPESLVSRGGGIDPRSQSFLSILMKKEKLPQFEPKKHSRPGFLSALLEPEKLPNVNTKKYTGKDNVRAQQKTSDKTPSGKISQ
jgi:hypothetical protein